MPAAADDRPDAPGTARPRVRRVVRRGGRAVTEVEGPTRARVRSAAQDSARPAASHDDADDSDAADDTTVLLDASGRRLDAATAHGARPLAAGAIGDDAPSPIVALAEAVRDYLDAVDRDGPAAAVTLRRRSHLRGTLADVDQLRDEPPRP